MDETEKMENQLSSAAAFMEGGILDACDDACSICLEGFSDGDPSTVSEELSMSYVLAARQFQGYHQLPVGSDAELEKRIIPHSAAAAAMGRARHIARRGRLRSGSHGRSQYLVPATNSDVPYDGSRGESEAPTGTISVNLSSPVTNPRGEFAETTNDDAARINQVALVTSEIGSDPSRLSISSSRHAGQASPVSQDRPGPSDFQSFSESLKSRLNAGKVLKQENSIESAQT